MSRHCFYHKDTGVFHNTVVVTDDESQIAVNTPPGHIAIECDCDTLSYKIDVVSREVVDYKPPQPSADHEWNCTTKRWQISEAEKGRRADIRQAQERLDRIESTQHRLMRKLILDSGDSASREQLSALDTEATRLEALIAHSSVSSNTNP